MPIRREFLTTLGTLIVLNLLLAFSSVALLSRMGPAIERILTRNVPSINVTQQMLRTLALTPAGVLPPEARAELLTQVNRARNNQTEKDEPAIIKRLQDAIDRYQTDEPREREAVVSAILELSATNTQAMERADAEARRLSLTGGWAAAVGGAISVWVWLLVMWHLSRRFLGPVLELQDVMEAHERGDRFRRCHFPQAADDLKRVLASVNRLLDARD